MDVVLFPRGRREVTAQRRRATGRGRRAPEPLWREAIGREVRAERTGRGERIADVAARAGLSPQYLSEIERGRKDPSSEMLSAVAGALDLTVGDLTRRAAVRLSRAGSSSGSSSVSSSGGPVLLAA